MNKDVLKLSDSKSLLLEWLKAGGVYNAPSLQQKRRLLSFAGINVPRSSDSFILKTPICRTYGLDLEL
jgi:hypothetical protein